MPRLAPDGLLVQTNLAGSLGDIQDDPDAPDANWLTAGQNVTTTCRVSFPDPAGDLDAAADAQEFRALVRLTATNNGHGSESVELFLDENGTEVASLGTFGPIGTGGLVIAGTWSKSQLSIDSGVNVQCRVVGTPEQGGGPNGRGSIEVGAIEWNSAESAAVFGLAGTLQSESDASGALAQSIGLAGVTQSDSDAAARMDAAPGLSGDSVSESDASAALQVLAAVLLSGTSVSESSISGAARLGMALAGTMVSESQVDGALEIAAQMLLSGTIVSQSDLGASLHRALGLSGDATSESRLDASVQLLQALRGRTESVSAAVGALGVELALRGDLVSESALSAALLESFTPGLLTIDAVRLVAALDGHPDLQAMLSDTPAVALSMRPAIQADAITLQPRK